MNLADEHNKGIADILSIMGQVAAITDGVIARRRQERRQDARDRQAQMNFELQFEANRKYREDALAQELGIAEANRDQRKAEFDATMKLRAADAADAREQHNMQAARGEIATATQGLETWMNIDKVNRLEYDKAKERFTSSLVGFDDKGNAVFASGAMRALFSSGPVKKAMKQQGVTPEDVAALAAAAATRGATGSFSAVVEALPEGPLRTALLASKGMDAADADWAQRMIQQAESYRSLYFNQKASSEHVAGLQTRLRAVEDAVDSARSSGSMRDPGWGGDFYDRIDAIGELDATLAGKTTDEQAAALAPEDWLGTPTNTPGEQVAMGEAADQKRTRAEAIQGAYSSGSKGAVVREIAGAAGEGVLNELFPGRHSGVPDNLVYPGGVPGMAYRHAADVAGQFFADPSMAEQTLRGDAKKAASASAMLAELFRSRGTNVMGY